MKLRVAFAELDAALAAVGAREALWEPHWQIDRRIGDWEIKAKLAGPGIVVTINDLEIGPAKVFTYKGSTIVIYIREQWRDQATIQEDPSSANKFHFSDCQKIREMKDKNRFERYVAIRPKTKIFPISSRELDGSRIEFQNELVVCRLCLKEIDWKKITTLSVPNRKRIAREFSLEEFFSKHDAEFSDLPRRTADAPFDEYVDGWAAISERHRAHMRWTCEGCNVQLSEGKDLLHCHHRNGVRSDNRRENLQALCLHCHAKAPGHRMHLPREDDRRLRRIKRSQNIFEV